MEKRRGKGGKGGLGVAAPSFVPHSSQLYKALFTPTDLCLLHV